ncbi:MAG: FRG domain-containing protein, partial [Sphingobacteriales bacterium]
MKQLDANTLEAENWIDLQHFLFDEYEDDIDRYRSRFVYRGVPDALFTLETSLQRIGRRPSEVEEHILRNFRKYAPINTIMGDYNNVWNWMAIGQHHALPTRLLDWTFSPNVALHFMTEDLQLMDLDGAIWMVDFVEMRQLLPVCLQDTILEKSFLTFTSFELSELIGSTIASIRSFAAQYGNALLFMEPPSIDDRMVNQFALFSFMLDPDTYKMDWLMEHPPMYKKIIIPAALKWEIRDKLDQANITERIV